MTARLTERGELVIGLLTERGRLVIGSLTETGRIVFLAGTPIPGIILIACANLQLRPNEVGYLQTRATPVARIQ